MSRGGDVTRLWGDQERSFRLGIGEWRKIQETCNAGPAEIASRLSMWAAMQARMPKASFLDLLAAGGLGAWRVDDIREPIYRGLIGGGMAPTAAGRLMLDLHDSRPLTENIALALEIVLASLVGPEDEPVGEPLGEDEARNGSPSPVESYASPTTTERVQ
ncbi:MAG TPA: gene transfer agent family protein [Caulobacteraceae bacterium]